MDKMYLKKQNDYSTADRLNKDNMKTKPFLGESDLEIKMEETKTSESKPQIDKRGAICAYFICHLPFDC
jgi:hypothetical protein